MLAFCPQNSNPHLCTHNHDSLVHRSVISAQNLPLIDLSHRLKAGPPSPKEKECRALPACRHPRQWALRNGIQPTLLIRNMSPSVSSGSLSRKFGAPNRREHYLAFRLQTVNQNFEFVQISKNAQALHLYSLRSTRVPPFGSSIFTGQFKKNSKSFGHFRPGPDYFSRSLLSRKRTAFFVPSNN